MVSTAKLEAPVFNRKERGVRRLLCGVFARENFGRSRDTESEPGSNGRRFSSLKTYSTASSCAFSSQSEQRRETKESTTREDRRKKP